MSLDGWGNGDGSGAPEVRKPTRLRDIAEESLTGAVCQRHRKSMNELPKGYIRVSTEQQDLTSQRNGPHALGCR
jgi:hypothetical protein